MASRAVALWTRRFKHRAPLPADISSIRSRGSPTGKRSFGLSTYDGADNVVFPPSPPNIGTNRDGFSFRIGDGSTAYNLYEDDGGYTPGPPYGCEAVYCLIGPGTVGAGDPFVALTSFSVNVVPEPSTWALLTLRLRRPRPSRLPEARSDRGRLTARARSFKSGKAARGRPFLFAGGGGRRSSFAPAQDQL